MWRVRIGNEGTDQDGKKDIIIGISGGDGRREDWEEGWYWVDLENATMKWGIYRFENIDTHDKGAYYRERTS